ncbi:MAG: hypothetical protein QXH21_09180 [Ignisphaera sp.]
MDTKNVSVRLVSKRKVAYLGKSMIVTIPPDLGKLLGIKPGDEINVYIIKVYGREFIAYSKN